ncbi:hypothetical protein HY635_03940 [Candidatus Uhrbacteria bacterium]|nr:hypothetical protein [Candidatus Uhrbacteria bacterium]
MTFHCFRFEGLHLEPVPGGIYFGSGTTRRSMPEEHVVQLQPSEPDRFRPQHAVVMLDVALQHGDAISYSNAGNQANAVRRACDDRSGESYRRMLFLLPGTEIEICLRRNGQNIVSRLRWNDGRLELVQDKPAGC